jgi:hypothetical protein
MIMGERAIDTVMINRTTSVSDAGADDFIYRSDSLASPSVLLNSALSFLAPGSAGNSI